MFFENETNLYLFSGFTVLLILLFFSISSQDSFGVVSQEIFNSSIGDSFLRSYFICKDLDYKDLFEFIVEEKILFNLFISSFGVFGQLFCDLGIDQFNYGFYDFGEPTISSVIKDFHIPIDKIKENCPFFNNLFNERIVVSPYFIAQGGSTVSKCTTIIFPKPTHCLTLSQFLWLFLIQHSFSFFHFNGISISFFLQLLKFFFDGIVPSTLFIINNNWDIVIGFCIFKMGGVLTKTEASQLFLRVKWLREVVSRFVNLDKLFSNLWFKRSLQAYLICFVLFGTPFERIFIFSIFSGLNLILLSIFPGFYKVGLSKFIFNFIGYDFISSHFSGVRCAFFLTSIIFFCGLFYYF